MILPLLLFAAVLPKVQDSATPPAGYTTVPAPSMQMRMSEATATRVPWVNANGWRFERGLKKAFYATLPKGSAALAAAEAYAYGVDAVLHPDPADLPALNAMLDYLKSIDQPDLPVVANIGVKDDGSDAAGEAMNLLGRRNLLYKVVKASDPKLDLNVAPTAEDARNPNEYAAQVREKLTDDKRLVRLYNASTVIVRLTGDGKHARLHMLNYSPRPVRDIRVRVMGHWKGVSPGVTDVEVTEDAAEFTVPELATYAAVDLGPVKIAESQRSDADFELTADPSTAQWKNAPVALITQDPFGKPIPGPATEVRSRWTDQNLYLMFTAPYTELNLKPDPQTTADTIPLWDWDVVEAFLGSDFEHIGHYLEFEVSPRGEWVDLDIDRDHRKQELGAAWNSGFTVRARIDSEHHLWYGEMRIPFRSIGIHAPKTAMQLRAGFYRCGGKNPNRLYYAWSPTGNPSFHTPQAFGILRLR